MHRTVYSLVLSDEVIAAVDDLAARQGLSRSALVEHALAEYTNLQPPGQVNRQILSALQAVAGENGLRAASASSTGITLRTALRCKYNPALSYTVLLQGSHQGLGQLRVSLRSTNQSILDFFALFFELWQRLEHKHLEKPPATEAAQMEAKRFLRTLRQPKGLPQGDDMGRAIAGYIDMMDGCMKAFFQNLEDAPRAVAETEACYLEALQAFPHLGGL